MRHLKGPVVVISKAYHSQNDKIKANMPPKVPSEVIQICPLLPEKNKQKRQFHAMISHVQEVIKPLKQ
uniref:Glycerol uptake protein n=1 Tax=Rhizophora mucronata TaxID=61149 RepID=A0A2P2KKV2_RHIMU